MYLSYCCLVVSIIVTDTTPSSALPFSSPTSSPPVSRTMSDDELTHCSPDQFSPPASAQLAHVSPPPDELLETTGD